jgi:hypothetical protein
MKDGEHTGNWALPQNFHIPLGLSAAMPLNWENIQMRFFRSWDTHGMKLKGCDLMGLFFEFTAAISHKTVIIRKVYLEKKEPLLVARETNHSPEAVQRYCLHFNKVKWCVDNGMSNQEITIVTGMRSHLIDEYLKIIKELNA